MIIYLNCRRKSSSSSTSQDTKKKQRRANQHDRDSAWFDKELEKIQRGKERLERERQKFQVKEERLEKMRNAWNKRKQEIMNNEEITVKTSKGEEFKFAGISETFTKKLFEWEERKGIAPESSTIALLNPDSVDSTSKDGLKRCHSEGSLPDSAHSGGGKAGGSEGNLSQTSSRSLCYLEKLDFAADKKSEKSTSPPAQDPAVKRCRKLTRTESLRTQASIKLLDEKLSMIGYLKSHFSHCR